jgi:hypothetical protein
VDHREFRALPDQLEHRGNRDQQDSKVLVELKALLAHRAHKERSESLEHRA